MKEIIWVLYEIFEVCVVIGALIGIGMIMKEGLNIGKVTDNVEDVLRLCRNLTIGSMLMLLFNIQQILAYICGNSESLPSFILNLIMAVVFYRFSSDYYHDWQKLKDKQ